MIFPRSKEEVLQEFRVQTIKDAAIRVIARKGIGNTTMQDIADEAGISKGTIYLYFSDRDDLLEKTFQGTISQLHDRLTAAVGAATTFDERMRAIVETKLAFFDENREFFRLYITLRLPQAAPMERQHEHRCQARYKSHVAFVAGIIRDGISAGEAHEVDPERAALFVVEGTNAILLQRISDPQPPSQAEEADLLLAAILHGTSTSRRRKGTKR